MTQEQEAEILCRVYNSIKIRNEHRVEEFLPKKISFKNDGKLCKLSNLYVYVRTLKNVSPFLLPKFYPQWLRELTQGIVFISDVRNVAIGGYYKGLNELILFGSCAEYKNIQL